MPHFGKAKIWKIFWILATVFIGCMGIRFENNPFSGFIERVELYSYDVRVVLQGGVAFRDDKIAIVGIDDDTFSRLAKDLSTKEGSKWPFPNSFHARVARRILDLGARSVVFDLLSFLNPSRERYQEEDQELASTSVSAGKIGFSEKFAIESGKSWKQGTDGQGFSKESWQVPCAAFRKIPRGYVNLPLDIDNRCRRFPPSMWRLTLFQEKPLALTGLELGGLIASQPTFSERAGVNPEPRYFAQVDPKIIGQSTISYSEFILPASGSRSLSDDELKKRVQDRVVFIGPTAPEFHDEFFTSFSGTRTDLLTPGVFIHAMIANNYLQQYCIQPTSLEHEKNIALAFMLGSILISVLMNPVTGLALSIMLALGYTGLAFAIFIKYSTWLPLASPLIAAAGSSLPNMALRLLVSEEKREMINKLFTAYVSGDVLEYVQTHPEALRLEGERREATVFFSDLKGFTTISETMPAEKLSQIMNDYLTPMTEIIMAHQGYLDKYIGDAIMAVFGAPMIDRQHALHACQAAIAQKKRLVQVAEEVEKVADVKISARMGINTGIVSAGNMGSKDRFQYTVMGDIVNQASRFEGANKIFGSGIMIGKETYEGAKDAILARLLAHLTVKGKTQAVVVYELIELRENVVSEKEAYLSSKITKFEESLSFFLKGEIGKAKTGFEEFQRLFPDDGPGLFYIEQCKELLSNGIPQGFGGEIKLDTK
ncbi:MAG: adenylate/guanylate cyclase domain-containing protein [Candidatus Riflebacteria bacterium]|nr:adenylate/guanylate cyclase domain-containing protein [Candidatus Riflebacteria bacterium]